MTNQTLRKPKIVPYSQHKLSRSMISKNVLKVLQQLSNAGYRAYLVGGCIRDILLGLTPKDFDVVTNAHPGEVRKLFKNCRLIGRRFRLAHVYFNRQIIEVSTFRASHLDTSNGEDHEEDGRIIRDNVYGTIDDDVWRRDFTVNALYYNFADDCIVDYVDGLGDIKKQQLRLIGRAEDRYREDPVRMLRAARFSAKLGFPVDTLSKKPIPALAPLLKNVPKARLFDEFLKLFMSGYAIKAYQCLCEHNLFSILFPQTEPFLKQTAEFDNVLLMEAFRNTDERLANGLSVTPGFLLAALLWWPFREMFQSLCHEDLTKTEAAHLAADNAFSRQSVVISIPRRFTHMAREIWLLQQQLENIQIKKPLKLLTHRRFRAAFDFLLLRARSDPHLKKIVDWWTALQEKHPEIHPVAIKSYRKKS